LQLILIDDDPVFRLGLRLWLNQFPDLQVVAEAGDGDTALEILTARLGHTIPSEPATAPTTAAAAVSVHPIDLIILDVSLGQSQPDQIQGLNLCQRIKADYPDIPILLLSSLTEPVILAAAQRAGADGYCPKDSGVQQLETVIRHIASGQPCWIQPSPTQISVRTTTPSVAPNVAPKSISPFAIARRNLRIYGIRQIEATLAEVNAQLQNLDLPVLDRAVLAGRRRELWAARWLVKRLLGTPNLPEEPQSEAEIASSAPPSAPIPPPSAGLQPLPPPPGQLIPISSEGALSTQTLQGVLFDTVLAKLQNGLQNYTHKPLEIDILREDKKRELLYLVLRKLEDALSELRYSQVQLGQLEGKRSLILLDLWETVLTDFFGKYYTMPIGGLEVEVASTLLQDAPIVQTEILDKIPFVNDLLAHLLFQMPLIIESNPYPSGSPDALARAELLLDHLVIQVANAVMQPLLNRFADVEAIKQSFYDRRLMSSREIERFRNNLSWNYRLEKYVGSPNDIFESQYRLFMLQNQGIKIVPIYAPRRQELEQLSGIQFVVTLALETRDAIAPRLRSALSVVGSSLIYVLTDVIGRGIGLIGRGILKGIGNAWQDNGVKRGSDR
jgi:DNA-binding NarL/FixJ family response regulator